MVLPAALVDRGRHDHQVSLCSDIEPWQEADLPFQPRHVLEKELMPAAASSLSRSLGKVAPMGVDLTPQRGRAFVSIRVEHPDPGSFTALDAEVGARPPLLPRGDYFGIQLPGQRAVGQVVLVEPRVLALMLAFLLLRQARPGAGAPSPNLGCMKGEHGPIELEIAFRRPQGRRVRRRGPRHFVLLSPVY